MTFVSTLAVHPSVTLDNDNDGGDSGGMTKLKALGHKASSDPIAAIKRNPNLTCINMARNRTKRNKANP